MANNYMGEARNPLVPLRGQQLLFAIDIVNHVMDNEWPDHGLNIRNVNNSESFREDCFKAFTGNTKNALHLLMNKEREAVKEKFRRYLENNEKVTEDSFQKFVEEYDREFNSLPQMRGLMRYCVTLALLSGLFYSEGVTQAPELAINQILMKLPQEQFMDSSYWDEVDSCAVIILRERPVEPEIIPNLNLEEYQEHDLQAASHPKPPL